MSFCTLSIVWLLDPRKLPTIPRGTEDGAWFPVVKLKLLWNLLVIHKSDLTIIRLDASITWFIEIDI